MGLQLKIILLSINQSETGPVATVIKGQIIEQVQSYKYLGTIIDSTLSFKENCEVVSRKGHQRLFCPRKLFRFQVD